MITLMLLSISDSRGWLTELKNVLKFSLSHRMQRGLCHELEKTRLSFKFLVIFINYYRILTLLVSNPPNGQAHSNNSSTVADELFKCV